MTVDQWRRRCGRLGKCGSHAALV